MDTIRFPLSIDTTPEDDFLYLGFSKQNLSFHQALGELVDNAISASSDNEYFSIEIHIEKNGDLLFLKVSDEGYGISIEDIQSKILRIGGKGTKQGLLNEHGFGLINSLCVLTGNKLPFRILTRDNDALGNKIIYKIDGPFRSDMIVEAGEETDWLKDVVKVKKDTGTRVVVTTSYQYFRTLYPSASSIDTLCERLMEHLGVFYRHIIGDFKKDIWIRYRDVTNGITDWTDLKVIPINIPYVNYEYKTISVLCNGKDAKATYTWGELDRAAVSDGSSGKPYPLKIYYQNNQKTQGVDIVVRKRVILPHSLEEIWPEKVRHNSQNHFIGELLIDEKDFSTVNNKTQLDPHNPAWDSLKEKLQDEEYKPQGVHGERNFTEEEIRSKLIDRLPSIVFNSKADPDYPTWAGLGVKIDILHKELELEKDNETIYEVKAGNSKPIDVYQLVMYWDGRVDDGVRPKLGRLIAKFHNPHIVNLIDYWNNRKDNGGEKYKLELKTIDEMM